MPTTIRWWRLRPWSRNHLMHRSDRVEATLVLLTAMLILLLIPFAAAFGTSTHTRLQHQTQALRTSVHQVSAVLLEDTYPAPDTTEYSYSPRTVGTENTARARWSTPHGDRTAAVPTDNPAKAGQTVTISVDADGNLTGPIPSTRDNTMVAVTAAFGIWALAAGAVLLPTALAHTLFNRNRLRRWAHDWKQLDKPPR
uniref:Rv1733c family protein n=1 Tax=Rhodococcus wratislaviensis TaxID=44752 RepID=UPI003F7EE66D